MDALICFCFALSSIFVTGSPYIAQANLKVLILLLSLLNSVPCHSTSWSQTSEIPLTQGPTCRVVPSFPMGQQEKK